METNEERTAEEIKNALELAKLSENEMLPVTQTVYFVENNFYNNNYKLFQLDKNLINHLVSGKTVYIKGDKDENAVMCTDEKTYDLNDTETSNSLLLINNLQFSEQIKENPKKQINKIEVSGIFYNYLEIVPGKPYFKKLDKLLECSLYKGPEFEYEIDKNMLYTFEELDSVIQSSAKELKEALSKMDIVIINDKIRLLEFEYHFRVLSLMLKLIEENSWDLDEINYEETVEALQDLVPVEIINCLFDKYTEHSKILDHQQLYAYKEKEICIFLAKVLLAQSGKFNLNEFFQAWKDSVPEGMVPDENMLYGIAIIDRNSTPNVIWAFSEKNLSDNVNERFKTLFGIKEKWTVPEITPYIRGLTTEKLDATDRKSVV